MEKGPADIAGYEDLGEQIEGATRKVERRLESMGDTIRDLIDTLTIVGKQFRWYEQLHAAKPDMEKAESNKRFAEKCEKAIERAK